MPHEHAKDWIDILAAFTPALGVLIAVLVAFMQWHLQREQWNQTLYQDRSKVYWAVLDLWTALRADTPYDSGDFATAVLPATHLFGSDVRKYVSEIKQKLFEIEKSHSPDERKKRRLELAQYIGRYFETKFDNYLQLHHDQNLLMRAKHRIDQWMESADARVESEHHR